MFKSIRTRQLEQALRNLADAVAHNIPGEVWNDEIDEALALATEMIGPMGEEPVPTWRWMARRRRQRAREDQAWSDGYNYGDREVEEALAGKDAFIAEQAGLIQDLIALGGAIDWAKVPDRMRSRLADYV